MKALDLMTPSDLWVCSDTDDCRHVAQLMADHDIGSIPVIDEDGRVKGIITDRDLCCRLIASGLSFETPAHEIMSTPVHTCSPESSLREIESLMQEYRIRRLPVVDPENRLLGFVSLGDLARHCTGLSHFWREHQVAEVFETVSTHA